ncbi:MAG: glycosyltransferase family 39 protein [Bacteroidales bacterium]|nr:glycosyltransferase family 39 protein [Bacteroidales bacterium]
MNISSFQVFIICIASGSIITSIVFQALKKTSFSLMLLLSGTFALFLMAASLDPFLNLWDERFHALVAKNLLNHPLLPTLYDDPVVSMAYDRWDRAVIWLHKQPLFLWQIALSFKLFGVSEFSLRLPSVLMSTGLVFFAYRIGYRILNQRTGYIAGLLVATSYHLIELVSGRAEVDHNDVAFLFYVTGSIWAWIEYISSGKRYWIILIGLFSGCAILCKWLVGLLVYAGWGMYNILVFRQRIDKYLGIGLALLITLAIVLPWQILIFNWYPAEATETLRYNTLHLTTVIEGHGGGFWYYVEHFGNLFGSVATYLILPSILVFILRIQNRSLGIAFLSMPLLVYLFFSIASTKMPSYPFVVAVPVFIALASAFDTGLEYLKRLPVPAWIFGLLAGILLAVTGYLNLQPKRIVETHAINYPSNHYSPVLMDNKEIYLELKNTLPDHSVIFNVKGRHYVECMFYTGFPSYSLIPTQVQVDELNAKGRTLAIFLPTNQKLPDYLLSREDIIYIDQEVKGWD